MARDRKRAKQRQRQRRGQPQPARVAADREAVGAPDPLQDASAEVEIAEAAMADPGQSTTADLEADDLPAPADLVEEPPLETDPRSRPDEGSAVRRAPAGAELPSEGNRLANFLRACVAELKRVQWPDRHQVTQATGVVVGFVIIAGAYLGLLDAIFSRLINVIL